jgi:hemerythrin
MPIIDWDDRYSIGVQKIDNHHKKLFSLLNKTYDSFLKFVPTDELDILFDELIDYTAYHFSEEEQLMQESRFPDFQAHKKEHDSFSQKIMEMHENFHSGKKSLSLEVISFLNNWLSNHILQLDAEIGRFLSIVNTNVGQTHKE